MVRRRPSGGFDSHRQLGLCIADSGNASVRFWGNTDEAKYEIVVVDNGSSQHDLDGLRHLGDGVRLITLGCNRFFGEANNIAAEAARGRYLCFLNNDAFVQPGWMRPLIDPLAADPAIGATGPLSFPRRKGSRGGGSR